MDAKTIDKKFDLFSQSKVPVPFSDLAEFFDALDPINAEEIIGKWQGGFIKSGNLVDWTLKNYGIIKWVGKNFIDQNNVKALLFKFLGIKFNFPIIGNARIRQVSLNNKLSTAMLYNHLPIIDHFRKIDDSTIMGMMDFKGKVVLYFYLYR